VNAFDEFKLVKKEYNYLLFSELRCFIGLLLTPTINSPHSFRRLIPGLRKLPAVSGRAIQQPATFRNL
jgi:hypothetical protein